MFRSKIKIHRSGNNLEKYLKFPLKFCQSIGMCISFGRTSKIQLILPLLLAGCYLYITALTSESNTTFLDIVDDFGDVLKSCVVVIVQFDMFCTNNHIVRCIKKLGASFKLNPAENYSSFNRWIFTIIALRVSTQIVLLVITCLPICREFSFLRFVGILLSSYIGILLYAPWLMVSSVLNLANIQFRMLLTRLDELQHNFTQKVKIFYPWR